MNSPFAAMARLMAVMGVCMGGQVSALEVNNTANDVFDLYYFSSGEVGNLGMYNQAVGYVQDSATYYWTNELQSAMENAVNTWTTTITNTYDVAKHGRKLRIGFFLDDGTGELMDTSMAGYASYMGVSSFYQPEYGTQANYYSVVEWAWRDNNITSGYTPPAGATAYYWETELLPSGTNNIDIAIVLNPVATSWSGGVMMETARSAQEMQNVATHEIAHGMGMDSRLYWQTSNGTAYYGDVTTWDSLLPLNGEHIVTDAFDSYGNKVVLYESLEALQAAAWEVPEGMDPYDSNSYTGNEIQYDPDRKLGLNGELGVHVSAVMLGGDTMEHLSYDDGLNVLGPGGRENGIFSENDLRALELIGWSVQRQMIPEPGTATLSLLVLAGLALRRRRGSI